MEKRFSESVRDDISAVNACRSSDEFSSSFRIVDSISDPMACTVHYRRQTDLLIKIGIYVTLTCRPTCMSRARYSSTSLCSSCRRVSTRATLRARTEIQVASLTA